MILIVILARQKNGELLGYIFIEKHIFKRGTNVSFHQHRDREFRRYSQEDGVFVKCTDIRRLLSELGFPSYNPDDLRLFSDTSNRSLECVLYNGQLYGSIPICHSMTAKESYQASK